MEPLRETDDTFCIALLGDFLGDASRGPQGEETAWIPRRATPDTVMKLLGLRPRARLRAPEGGGHLELALQRLEDFHPESLFKELELFAPFREARAAAQEGRPLDPELLERMGLEATGGEVGTVPPSPIAPEGPGAAARGSGSLLDSILDEAQPPESDSLLETPEQLQAFVRSVVRPHLVPPDEDGPRRVARVDEAAGELLSALLHDPAFRALESLWRSLVFLLSRVDTAGKVRVYAVHLPRHELEADLRAEVPLTRTRLFALLARADLGAPARRWGAAVGAYAFGTGPSDLALLSRLGSVAEGAGVPWFSSFHPVDMAEGTPGDPPSSPGSWDALRSTPGAASLHLTHPRFLVREPYSPARRPRRGIAFRESVGTRDDLLWAHGGILAAALLGQAHAAGRGGMLGRFREEEMELGGMPLWPSESEGGTGSGSTERVLDLDGARLLLDLGIIPLLSFPARATVRLGGIRPLASTPGR